MAKYLRKKKSSVIGYLLVIAATALLFLLLKPGKTSFCVDYWLTLPEGYVLQQDRKTQDSLILSNGYTVGGVLHCPFSKGETPQLYPLDRTACTTVVDTLKAANAPGTNPGPSDYMDYIMENGGGMYSCVASFINESAEYQHYMLFFEAGILTLWFDTARIDSETMEHMSSNFSVDP